MQAMLVSELNPNALMHKVHIKRLTCWLKSGRGSERKDRRDVRHLKQP